MTPSQIIALEAKCQQADWEWQMLASASWYCDRCQVEVYRMRCPHCGKSKSEEK